MQISDKNRPVKIGVISLWGLAIFIIVFIFFIVGTNQKMFTSKYSLLMFVPGVQGLNSGAFITLSGLKVGVVGDMQFTKRNDQQGILVELKIDRKFATKITTSSIAMISTMGMLGDKYVDISLGNLSDPALAEGDFIQTSASLDLAAMASSATAAIDEFRVAMKNINAITENALNGSGILGMLIEDHSAKANLANSLANLDRLLDRIEKGKGSLGQFARDTTLYSSLKNTASSLDKITAKVERGEGSLGRMVADTLLYARLNSISLQTDSLLKNLQQGQGSAGKLFTDEKLYEQLVLLTKTLSELTKDIQENPKKYVTIKIF
jgi:phospholipid/cholesterol/gamma-HCH transport system substrate-binding protein